MSPTGSVAEASVASSKSSKGKKKAGKHEEKEDEDLSMKWEGRHTGGMVDGIRQGKGSATFPNGDVYKGDFRNGMRDGEGVLLQADGVRYEGTWFRSMRHGTGRERWPNGDVYEGEYKLDKFEGKGALKTRGGWYRGDFKDGVKVTPRALDAPLSRARMLLRRVLFYLESVLI